MDALLAVVVFLIFLTQVFFLFLFAQHKLFEITARFETANLLLAVIANKLGATEEDVKEAIGKK